MEVAGPLGTPLGLALGGAGSLQSAGFHGKVIARLKLQGYRVSMSSGSWAECLTLAPGSDRIPVELLQILTQYAICRLPASPPFLFLKTARCIPGESHGQRGLVGYSPWGRKESDTTERLSDNR